MQAAIEQALSTSPFNMGRLYSAVWPLVGSHTSLSTHLFALETRLNSISPTLFSKISQAILRKSFLIQAVTTIGGSANMRVRWYDALTESQRYCSFDECVEIASDLLDQLASGWLDEPQNLQTLSLIEKNFILSYEWPIDYRERVASNDPTTTIHRKGNIGWHSDPTLLVMLKLRQALKNPAINPDALFFRGPLKNKMLLLGYQTGRAQTGDFKTNREQRWEAHPRSPQFAVYSSCAHIEHKITCQICDFDEFPAAVRQTLQDQRLLAPRQEIYADPITLTPLNYREFKNEVENPEHGSNNYQLGHMVPLNSADADLAHFGHSAANVSWITADGNRIQGKSSVTDIRNLLIAIAKRYEEKGLIPEQALPHQPPENE